MTPRRATDADLAALLEVEAACFDRPWPAGAFAEELALPQATVLVLPDGGRLAGYVDYWVVDREISLMNVAVHPDYQRRGLGKVLLDAMESEAGERGGEEVFLEVRAGNVGAQALYERCGYQPCGIRKRYYDDTGEDAVLLHKLLR